MKTVFLRALDSEDKGKALRASIAEGGDSTSSSRFDVDVACFKDVPGSPFAYWMSEQLRSLFKTSPAFLSAERTAVLGLKTSEDSRFVRLHWEVPLCPSAAKRRWIPFAKGGEFSSFYVSIPTVVDWLNDGAQSWAFYEANRLRTGGMVKNPEYYFRPGITWLLRSHRFAPQALPAGCIFSLRSYCAFTPPEDLLSTMAIFSSSIFDYLYKTTLGRFGYPEFIVGALLRLPWVETRGVERIRLQELAYSAWAATRLHYTCVETSHAFTLPALLQVAGSMLSERVDAWVGRARDIGERIAGIQQEIDEKCLALYQVNDVDRRVVRESYVRHVENGDDPDNLADSDESLGGKQESAGESGAPNFTADLVSWAVGVAFGRFDVRLAIGERAAPPPPEPFDSLPISSPGMLAGDDGSMLASAPEGYPIAFPADGLLIDDIGHERDLYASLRCVFTTIFGEDAENWSGEIGRLLDPGSVDLRGWLARGFFEHHLKRYSASRRKAPVIWQIAIPSGRFSVWAYAHRLDRDSFLKIQNDLVAPKVLHESRKLLASREEAGPNPDTKQQKEIETQAGLVEELNGLLDEIRRVTPLWHPSLNDGAMLTMAPLWRLMPHFGAWQKELKVCLSDLVAGKYDWSHLAMHLWPERVVPKCATDRSFAIAHGLEDNFWFKDVDGKWASREKPKKLAGALVRERTSSAVKAALKSLLEAPDASGGTKRTRKSRAA
jgi:hypothetical protein